MKNLAFVCVPACVGTGSRKERQPGLATGQCRASARKWELQDPWDRRNEYVVVARELGAAQVAMNAEGSSEKWAGEYGRP
eukprot:3427390-Prymnesium_polylepis.1